MNGLRRMAAVGLTLLAASALSACGGSGEESTDTPTETSGEQPAQQATPTRIDVVAKDYGFDLPATFRGGLVEMTYTNAGKEPHFAAFARLAPGKTMADVRTFLTTPPSATPSGPPPFEELAAFPTGDPGTTGKMTVNLPAGTYALYCAIPSPDGAPHTAKGMIQEVQVTEGPAGSLPPAAGPVKAVDFSLSNIPELTAGKNVVGISNQGKQLHEINLVELNSGKSVQDAVTWFRAESGPPPMKFLTGVAVAPGQSGTAEFDLKAGSSYAFVCAIPDFLGDFKPHATKGMVTSAFTVA